MEIFEHITSINILRNIIIPIFVALLALDILGDYKKTQPKRSLILFFVTLLLPLLTILILPIFRKIKDKDDISLFSSINMGDESIYE